VSKITGFRSKGHGDDRKVYPVFDPLKNVGVPLKSARFMGSSREQVHQLRAAKVDRNVQEQEYATYVARSLHGHGNVVKVTTPSRTVNLKLAVVNVKDIKPSQHLEDTEVRAKFFENEIKAGRSIPPMLVHKTDDGKYVVADGHARLIAFKRCHVEKVPVVENSLSDVLGKIGRGVKAVITAPAHVHIPHYPKEGETDTGKYLPPPPGRLKHIQRLRAASSAVGGASQKIKEFRERTARSARLRTLRRKALSKNLAERREAKLALATEFPMAT